MGVVPIAAPKQLAGRLAYHLVNWQVVTKDVWVLQGIKEPGNGFLSNIFLVPKKDGGQRPVINLKALNQFLHPHHFKIEGIHTLRDLVRPGDWLTKVDLKDAFFTIPILPQEVPQVQLPREHIPVQLPHLRSLLGTMGLYQDPQTSNSHSETVGGTVDSIHRRHTNPGGDQGTSLRGNSSPDIPTGKSGFHNQPEKVCNGTRSDNRVFGLDNQYPIDDFEPPSEQNERFTQKLEKWRTKRLCRRESSPASWGK